MECNTIYEMSLTGQKNVLEKETMLIISIFSFSPKYFYMKVRWRSDEKLASEQTFIMKVKGPVNDDYKDGSTDGPCLRQRG